MYLCMYLCMYLVCIWFTGIAPADNEANKLMTSKLPCSSCKFYYQPLHKAIFMLLRVSATYYSHHQGDTTLQRHKQRIVSRQMLNKHTLDICTTLLGVQYH